MTKAKPKKLYLIVFILMSIQFAFWHGFGSSSKYWQGTKSIKPDLEVVPAAPSVEMLKAFSFGDEQLVFRYYGYVMQFLGDTFGRVTPLKNYDYSRLYRWWLVLDDVDPKSNLIAHVVAYYYSASQNPKEHTPYIVDFLEYHSDKNPEANWWWYSQAVYNAQHKMQDSKRALEIAKKLADLPKDMDIPIWTRQLQAFIYEKEGEYKSACDIIVNVIRDYGDNKVNQGEINFMFNFITERLRKLVENEKNIDKKDISPECRKMMEVQKATDLNAKAMGLEIK